MSAPSQTILSRSVLNVVLVLIESLLTLVLRFDARLRRSVYPLVKADTLVCIRTYLPHTEVYATFGYKGVLLDDKTPKGREPEVTINAYSHQLLQALVSQDQKAIDTLQIQGVPNDVALVKAFLQDLSVFGLVQSLIQKVSPSNTPSNPSQKAEQDKKLKDELAETIKQKEAMHTQVRKLSTELKELQGKHQHAKIALIVMTLIALLLAVYVLFFKA